MDEQDYSGVHIWLVLMKSHQALQKHAEQSIQSTGLCFSDFATLEVLLHKGPMPINAIGDKVPLTSGSLTAAVDRLEKKGYVTRQYDAEDRRIRMVHLTSDGESLIRRLFDRHCADLDRVTRGLTEDECKTLLSLLKKLGKTAASLSEMPPV